MRNPSRQNCSWTQLINAVGKIHANSSGRILQCSSCRTHDAVPVTRERLNSGNCRKIVNHDCGASRASTMEFAWHYKRPDKEQTPAERCAYAQAEDSARVARTGRWRHERPVPPQEFRRRFRTVGERASRAKYGQPRNCIRGAETECPASNRSESEYL